MKDSKAAFLQQKNFTYVFFIITFLLEYALFRNFISDHIIPYYPANFDQSGYLSSSYELYDKIRSQGLHFSDFSSAVIATSFSFITQTVLFFLFFGGSRLSALTLNFIFFIILQLISFSTIKSITNKTRFAFIFLGLLLTIASPYHYVGGMLDYRIDFMAFCIYGIFIACVIRSYVFLNRTWTFISALIAVYLILLRFLTSIYLCGITATLLGVYLVQWLYYRNNNKECHAKKRIKNILFFSFIILIFCAPILFLYKEYIYNYYVVGHLTGSEVAIRMKELDINNFIQSLSYYPKSILTHHIAYAANIMVLIILLVTSLTYILNKYRYRNNLVKKSNEYFSIFLFLTLSILIPLIILTIDQSKSPVVGSIIIPPLLWFIICVAISNDEDHHRSTLIKLALRMLAIVFFGYGCLNYFLNFSGLNTAAPQASELNKMYDDIGNYIDKCGLKNPLISSDQIIDYLAAPTINALYFEKHHHFLNLANTSLGGSIFAITKKQLDDNFKKTNFYITNLNNYPKSTLPANASLNKFSSLLKQQADNQMIVLGEYSFNGSIYRLYARPSFSINNVSGDWITANGIILTIPAIVAQHTQSISMSGTYPYQWLSEQPIISASIENTLSQYKLNITFQVNENHYMLNIDLPSWKKNMPLIIKLIPSTYFIPKLIGLNEDERKLVMYAPEKIYLRSVNVS